MIYSEEEILKHSENDYKDSMLLSKMTFDCIDILQNGKIVDNEKIQSMIQYFLKMEKYELCAKLKSKMI